MRKVFTTQERIALVEKSKGFATLDNDPATVTGYRLDFPMVSSRKQSVEFSWATVERILNSHGQFKS